MCYAHGKKCHNCDGMNHFASVCRRGNDNKKKKCVNQTTEACASNVLDSVDSDSSGGSRYAWSIRACKKVSAFISTVKNFFMPMILLTICCHAIKFCVDTGAEVYIMDESTFRKLKYI